MQERLLEVLEPAVVGLGYELVHVELVGIGEGRVLRVYIDAEDGIDVDDCEKVSRDVSALLDVEDIVRGRYNLEVSSPGLDRPLVKPSHFQRFAGEEVKMKLAVPRDGRRSYKARIVEANDEAVSLDTDEGIISVAYADIEKARLVPVIKF